MGTQGQGQNLPCAFLPFLCLARGTAEKFYLTELYYKTFPGHAFPLECALAGEVSGFLSKCSCSCLCKSTQAFFMHEIFFLNNACP